MTDQINSNPVPPANNDAGDTDVKFCKICGEALTETNRSKEKKDVCLDCEGKSETDLDDPTQKNVNQDGVDTTKGL